MKRLILFILMAGLLYLGSAKATSAQQWVFNPTVAHRMQDDRWSCGPTTIAMWAGHIRRQSLNVIDIANRCCGTNGTTIPEFVQGMYNETPYGYVFAEWEYSDQEAAVKGIMWSIARFNEPMAVAGGTGNHYVMVRGGRANQNPYNYYSESNHITGVWVNDSTEGSNLYSGPVSGMYRNTEYHPSKLMNYWTKIGASNDKKHRSIERECYACWSRQGQTYENNNQFTNY